MLSQIKTLQQSQRFNSMTRFSFIQYILDIRSLNAPTPTWKKQEMMSPC